MKKHLTEGCVPSFSAVNSFSELRQNIELIENDLAKLDYNYFMFFSERERFLIKRTKDYIERIDELLYKKIEEKQKAELKKLNTKKKK